MPLPVEQVPGAAPWTVQAGGYAAVVSDTLERPANTTQYASGDLLNQSATAGLCKSLLFQVGRTAGGTVAVRRARVSKTDASVTTCSIRIHLYRYQIKTFANGDNGAWSTTGAADWLGSLDVTVDQAFSDGAAGVGAPTTGSEVTVSLPAGQTAVFGVAEMRSAYTPASGEKFTFSLEVFQN